MIKNHKNRSPHWVLAAVFTVVLGLVVTLQPTTAQPPPAETAEEAAVSSMNGWLKMIDEGRYAASWEAASRQFQAAITSGKWVAALDAARKPLGACKERKLASALHQTSVPDPKGGILKGDYVIAQFQTSFANLKYAVETVTFEKEPDGAWKASGYYVRPGN